MTWKPTLEDSKIDGANNRSVFVAGLPNTRMDLLDNTDRLDFEFTGLPSLLHILPAVGSNPEVKAKLEGMAFAGSEGPGYTAVGFGGISLLNHGLFSLLRVGGHHTYATVINAPVTMTGVAAQAMPAGDDNLSSVFVRKLQDNATGQATYVEGVDYTLGAVAGTVTRIAAGLITDGQVVFVEYNAADSTANNRRDIAHVNVKVVNCNRSGRFDRIAGVDHSNTEFGGCCISRARRLRTSPSGVNQYAIITEAGVVTPDAGGLKYADMTWDNVGNRPIHPVNLEMKSEKGEDSRMPIPWGDFGVDGQPGVGDTSNYIFGSKTVVEASIQYKNNKMIEANVDNASGLVQSISSGFGAGRRIRISQNEAINSGSIAAVRLGRDRLVGRARLSGWIGELDDIEVNGNEAIGARSFADTLGGFANQQIRIRNNGGGAAEKSRNLKVSGGTIKLSKTEVPFNSLEEPVTISIERVDGCGVEAVKLESKAPARTAIRVFEADNCRIDDCDFKKYAKAADQVDIEVTAGSIDNTLVIKEEDLILDEGTDTVKDIE